MSAKHESSAEKSDTLVKLNGSNNKVVFAALRRSGQECPRSIPSEDMHHLGDGCIIFKYVEE